MHQLLYSHVINFKLGFSYRKVLDDWSYSIYIYIYIYIYMENDFFTTKF